jgi:ABC-2 type transport system ATP-binding protein
VSPPAKDLFVVENLTKAYGDLVALDKISLSIGPKEQVALLGLNGSGKTTLLRISAGLLEPTSGKVILGGQRAGTVEARRVVSYIPDSPVLYDDLSVNEHLEYVARMHETADWESHAEDLVDRLGLSHRADDLPSTFSRGLRQKVSIALAFVRPFDVMLVDEPFVGLDAPGRAALLDLLRTSAEDGAAIIVSTHQTDYLRQATRCVGLRDGTVIYNGKPSPKAEAEILT